MRSIQKLKGLRNPRQRLQILCETLERQLASPQDKERAWSTYNKALSLTKQYNSYTDLTQVILNFDSRFGEETFNSSLSVGQAVSFLLAAKPQNFQNLEAVWRLSYRFLEISSIREVKQEICLQLARFRGSNNTLLAKLQKRLNEDLLTAEELTPILTIFLENNSFDPPDPWRGFLQQFHLNKLPKMHQVYGVLGHYVEASNFAETAQDYRSAIDYLMNLSGKEIAFRIMSLSNNLGDENTIAQAHQKVAESFYEEKDYVKALENFQRAGNLEGASDCHLRLGELGLAIEYHPDFSSEWVEEVRAKIENTVRFQIDTKDFLPAVCLLKSVEDAWLGRSQKIEAEFTHNLLLQAVKTSRASFTKQLQTSENQEQEIFKQWSLVEEAAGNYLEAALQAEKAQDYFTASVLFEKAEAFGQALVALESTSEDPISPQKKAQLLEKGGDFFMAGMLYESLGEIQKAISMYEQASEFLRASELLRQQLGEEKVVFESRFKELLTKAGRIEELAELCATLAQKVGRAPDEKARLWRQIKTLGEQGLISQKWLDLVDTELPSIEAQDRQKFEKQATRLVDTAIKEVLAEYTDAIGLDLGTSNSVVCLYNKRLQEPEVIEYLGKRQFPSVFAIDKTGKEIIGLPILSLLSKSPRAIITKAKREMGTDRRFQVGKQTYRAEEIAARIINYAYKLAKDYLKQKIGQKLSTMASQTLDFVPSTDWVNEFLEKHPTAIPLTNIVITVPAYFNEAQKQATKRAAVLAESSLLRLIHEPTAACIAQQRYKKNEIILVADLGAGTFDISSIEVGEGVFEVLEIEGDNTLGSADLDELIYNYFDDFIKDETGQEVPCNSQAATRVRQACEELKIELSSQSQWTINLPYLIAERTIELSLTREDLERIASPWLEKIRLTCHKIREKPNRILLIGGGCLMPAVRDCIQNIFNVETSSDIDPLTAVARGAALQAAILMGDLKHAILLDITPFSLGIKCIDNSNALQRTFKFDSLIPKHTTIPTKETKRYSTVEDNQTRVHIEIFQGESLNPLENFKIGDFIFGGILLAKAGSPQIDVTFDIDTNCLLTVTAYDVKTGKKTSIEISDSHLLTPAQTDSLKAKFRHSQVYQENLTSLQKINLELTVTLGEVEKTDLLGLSERFKQGIQTYEQYRQRYAPRATDNNTLFSIYRERNSVQDKTRVALDQWDTLSRSVRLWLETFQSLDWRSTDINYQVQQLLDQGNGLIQRTNQAKLNVDDIATQYQRWLSVLKNLPISREGDAEELAKHLLSLQRYKEAQSQFQRLNTPFSIPQIELGLEILARSRQREAYTAFFLENSESLAIHLPDLEQLNHSVRKYSSSVVWIQVNLVGLTMTGSGFVISPNQIATNRHVLIDQKTGNCVAPETIRIMTKEGALTVTSISLPSFGDDDVAILHIQAESAVISPLRLGFSELVEVGERIITLGFPSPEKSGFTENLYCNTGLVNRIRSSQFCTERVLEVSIPLQGGISGSPILNKLGEVIGLLTYSLDQKRELTSGQIRSERSFYAIPVNLLRRLCAEQLIPTDE